MASGTDPSVTLVVPCCRRVRFLDECLDSLIAQNYPHWRALVIDDACEGSERIREAVTSGGDNRIALVRHERSKGRAAARNTGFAKAGTHLVACVEPNDLLDPKYLELLVPPILEDRLLDCIFPDMWRFGAGIEQVRISFRAAVNMSNLLRDQVLPGHGVLMRRDLWLRTGGYDEGPIPPGCNEDWDFWIRAVQAGCCTRRVAEVLYRHRASASGIEQQQLAAGLQAERIYARHRELFTTANAAGRFLGSGYATSALARHKKGSRLLALSDATRAFRHDPSPDRLWLVAMNALPMRLARRLDQEGLAGCVPWLGYPIRSKARYRPFFIIGAGRSGTTLTRRVLTVHPQLHIPPETYVLQNCLEIWRRYARRISWPSLVELLLAQYQFHPEFHTFQVELRPLVKKLRNAKAKDRNLAHCLNSFYAYHAESRGRSMTRWGDKTPLNSYRSGTLERILSVFPDAQFIHVIRDGSDVAYSHYQQGFSSSIEHSGRVWATVVRQTQAFTRAHAAQSVEMKYEDLVRRPEETIAALCAFLEVPYHPDMVHSEGAFTGMGDVPRHYWHRKVGDPIDAGRIGAGRRLLSPEDKARLEVIIGRELRRLGYAPCTS